MRSVVQRVTRAEVRVDDQQIGAIDQGLLVLLGVHQDDTIKDVAWMADRLVHLRVFEDQDGRMNRSLIDTGGDMLVVSQFTLMGDCHRGRRPSWSKAAPPEQAGTLYRHLVKAVNRLGIHTATGEFQAMMNVSLVNNGPVTLLLDSHKNF